MEKILFDDLEEARLCSGYFVRDICKELAISERSYYRWKKEGLAPKWVSIALNLLCGRLDHLGWKGWYIVDGKLCSQHHHSDHYSWTPGELLEARFWELNKTPSNTMAQKAWNNRKSKINRPSPSEEEEEVSTNDDERRDGNISFCVT